LRVIRVGEKYAAGHKQSADQAAPAVVKTNTTYLQEHGRRDEHHSVCFSYRVTVPFYVEQGKYYMGKSRRAEEGTLLHSS
jgi:hypothetical protein